MSENNEKPEYVQPEPRMNYAHAFSEGFQSLMAWGKAVRLGGLEHSLVELVKMRASILNGCAFCVDMHSREAMGAGETSQRLFAVAAWHEAPFFTARERAALQWTDAITTFRTATPTKQTITPCASTLTSARQLSLRWRLQTSTHGTGWQSPFGRM